MPTAPTPPRPVVSAGDVARSDTDELLLGRFQLLEELGSGGSGEVYRAHDTILDQAVALKRLRSRSPNSAYDLKREFRRLADLRHRNIVAFYELFQGEGAPFFTMELIEGRTFADFGRDLRQRATTASTSEDGFDAARSALRQLALGLGYLHRVGMVHRDIKPANVLVEPNGRLAFLDFGLATDLRSDLSRHSRLGNLVGTFAYMSPEQIDGLELTGASDWYSVGTMLYEALTGRLPREFDQLSDLLSRRNGDVVPPEELGVDLPYDLASLILSMLEVAPESRPDAAAVLDRLGSEDAPARSAPNASSTEDRPLVGREREHARLVDAVERSRETPTSVVVSGAVGLGKSRLVRSFLDGLDPSKSVVLRSRCSPRESVPFGGFDGLVDELARFLSHAPREVPGRWMPRYLDAALSVFPALAHVSLFEELRAPDRASDRRVVRRRAFAAIREMFARIADQQALVLWIDDAQWEDEDGKRLADSLMRGEDPPRLLIVRSLRADAPDLAERERSSDVAISLPPLAREAIEELLNASPWLGVHASPDSIRRFAEVCEGNPGVAHDIAATVEDAMPAPAQLALMDPRDLLSPSLEGIDAHHRRILSAIAVARQPLPSRLLTDELNCDAASIWALADLRLVEIQPSANGDEVGIPRAAVRTSVLDGMDAGDRRNFAREVADALERTSRHAVDTLVDLWVEAGNLEHAANLALRFADQAVAAFALDRGADLYRRALRLGASAQPRWLVLSKRARVLSDLGRVGEAAPTLRSAAAEVRESVGDASQEIALFGRSVFSYLMAGDRQTGLEVLEEACGRADLPFPSSRARSVAMITMPRLFGPARRSQSGCTIADRLDLAWDAAQCLRFIDAERSTAFLRAHDSLARAAGDPKHLSRALGVRAMMRVFRQAETGWDQTAETLVEAERLARVSGDAPAIAHAQLMRATSLSMTSRWRECLETSESGEALCVAECPGARFELATFHQNILLCLVMMGRLGELASKMDAYIEEAEAMGDELACSVLPLGSANMTWLVRDDPVEAERRIDEAMKRGAGYESDWMRFNEGVARANLALSLGDGEKGLRELEDAMERMNSRVLLRAPGIRINLGDIRGRLALAAFEREPPGSRGAQRWLARASREARTIRRSRTGWAQAFADRLDGIVAGNRGDLVAARRLVERAALSWEHQGLDMLAVGARYRLSLFGDDDLVATREKSANWLREHGVKRPDRLVFHY